LINEVAGSRVVLGFADDSVVVLDPGDRRGEQIQDLAGAISEAAVPLHRQK
jgi:hypothetical protein